MDQFLLKKQDFTTSRISFQTATTNIITYNDVELSVLADIGSSSFIYDMRNIKEVFIFPKIWYRRSLARRLFLGEETSFLQPSHSAYKTNTSNSNLINPNQQNPIFNTNNNNNNNNTSTGFLFKNDFKSNSTSSLNELKRRKFYIFNFILFKKSLLILLFYEAKSIALNLEDSSYCVNNSKWKTLVLISVNLAEFEVKMNIGSAMGNVRLFAKNAKTKSRISISNFGKKCMLFNFILDNCRIIAEGGSNGCLFRIQDITSTVEVNDNKNNETTGASPFYKIDFGIFATECRVDSAYNSATPILAFRLSSFNLKLNDSWEFLGLK